MTKEELKKIGKIYFDHKKPLVEIFATEDGHFFYEEIQAKKFCGGDKEFHKLTRNDYETKTPSISDELTPKQKLQKEAKELNISYTEKTTSTQLNKLIDGRNLENLKLSAIDLEVDFDDSISFEELTALVDAKK